MAKRHRMTSARRAALRKAQLASARKRRRKKIARGAKAVGVVAGGIAVSAISYHANNYARHPTKALKDYRSAKGYIQKKRGKVSTTPAIKKRRPIGYYPSSKAQTAAMRRRRR